jgi:hypothetical protein
VKIGIGIALALVAALVGCDEKKQELRSATAAEAGATPEAGAAAEPSVSATPPALTVSADADTKRFDPKHKCPTGQTHFYLEGDFCRRKCVTNGDCGKKERCSAIEYPFVVDGGTGGMARFCEGT